MPWFTGICLFSILHETKTEAGDGVSTCGGRGLEKPAIREVELFLFISPHAYVCQGHQMRQKFGSMRKLSVFFVVICIKSCLYDDNRQNSQVSQVRERDREKPRGTSWVIVMVLSGQGTRPICKRGWTLLCMYTCTRAFVRRAFCRHARERMCAVRM